MDFRNGASHNAVNLPNLITLSRIPLLFLIVACLFMPWRGAAALAFILFIVGAVSDWLDGYLARRYGLISNFGKLMDALTDKIFMLGLFVALLVLGVFEPWTLAALFAVLLITAREFMITGLRLLAASRGVVLAAEKSGKIKTVFQLLSAGVLLFGHFLAHDLGSWPGAGVVTTFMVSGGVLFGLATLLTVMSGTGYLIKYWHLMREDIVV